jgi:hypothetical protein
MRYDAQRVVESGLVREPQDGCGDGVRWVDGQGHRGCGCLNVASKLHSERQHQGAEDGGRNK